MILLSYCKQIRQRMPATHLEGPSRATKSKPVSQACRNLLVSWAPDLASPLSTVANRCREMAKSKSLFFVSIASVILTSRQYEIKSAEPQSTELHQYGDNLPVTSSTHGWAPPARSMIANRVWPSAMRVSTKMPLASGPRWASARFIAPSTPRSSGPGRLNPTMPHTIEPWDWRHPLPSAPGSRARRRCRVRHHQPDAGQPPSQPRGRHRILPRQAVAADFLKGDLAA